MYHWHDTGWAWWWMLPMMVFMLAVVGIIAWAIVSATRPHAPSPPASPSGSSSAEAILAERFARGEIDSAEYRERVAALREHGSP